VPLFVSEYGAGSDERVHSRQPVSFDFSTEYQQRFHEAAFRQILDRPWLIGSAVWAQFDFGSDYRQDTKYGINQKGLWYYDRTPKDIAAFYRAHLRDEPVLHIAARDWRRRVGSRAGDTAMPVRIYSNEQSAELFVNGESLGAKNLQNRTAEWSVPFAPGENILAARSRQCEDQVRVFYEDRRALFAGRPAHGVALAVNAGGSEQYIGGDDLVWEADRAYERGSWGYVGGASGRSHHRIFETFDDPLYQTRRLGAHVYRFDVADGTYRVELHFARLKDSEGASDRDGGNFSVNANGLVVSVGAAPPFTGRQVELLVAASGDRRVTLKLEDGSGEAYVNGIVIQRGDRSTRTETALREPGGACNGDE
jgi:beta-galactosidase